MELRRARRTVLDVLPRLPGRRVPLEDALGCVTVAPVRAPHDVPSFANSAMDGYAVRSADAATVPARLVVAGELRAGVGEAPVVATGRAVRVMTGAPVPPGADAVVPVEDVTLIGDDVVVRTAPEAGAFVRPPGSDAPAGAQLLPAGTRLTPRAVCVLAACGFDDVPVVPRLRVGVLSTGDELAAAGCADQRASICDANGPALRALLREAGFDPVDLGVVGDDVHDITEALADGAARCDAVVTSGGVSVGDADYVKLAHRALGAGSARWMQVAIKPAKPFSFALLHPTGIPAFGLAGNPVSAQVGFELFVRPALRKMAGHTVLDRAVASARATAALPPASDGKLHLARVAVRRGDDGVLLADAAAGQGSHMALAMARADGLALVGGGPGIPPGGCVDVLLLDDDFAAVGSPRLDDVLSQLGQS